MSDLKDLKCTPLTEKDQPLSDEKASSYLSELHADWNLNLDAKIIYRECRFKNYYQTMAFVNAVAWIAHQQDHHPDLEVSYNSCNITFTTHQLDGLSENDFICAAKIDELV